MKKTFRTPLSLALALALAADALAGCGESRTADADLPEGAVSIALSDDGITVDGAAVSADADDLSDLLRLINMAGAGRTGTAPTDPPLITIDYGDGTTLDIWQVPLENPANDWTDGPFFRCTFPSGKTYGYDTDQIPMTRLTRLFS